MTVDECESSMNDSLKNLGYEIEIRYWSIASQVIMRQGILLRGGLTMAVKKKMETFLQRVTG